ncbi:SGNH/GDSL hydrolase family protein, partial [Ilumatobacter sp.]|uniref:SGNH/GDSL hydrolase family protein n=1 Tax=Ilumatobacter sp. TaxID=1967498 RepID=UPI003AF6CB24
ASWAMGLAFVAMFVVWVWMAVVTQNPGLAFVMGLMIALAGGFFVLRGEGIVLLMMAGYIVAWGLVDRSVSLAEAVPVTEGEPVRIVALGDSFISGEGAPEFFEGTNEAGGNQCRRAPTAHPYLMAAALETNVVSLACSGAKVADLISCGQMWPDGRRCRVEPPAEVATDDDAVAEAESVPDALMGVWSDALVDDSTDDPPPPGALPQIVTAIDRELDETADVILLSIGGNDVGFSSIVKACLLPKGCDERREIWLDSIDLLGPQLDEAYTTIGATFSSATVMVMPYPMLVNAEETTRCDLGLSRDEREFVVDFIQKLDVTIAEAAGRAGFVYVEDAVAAYEGFQLCDDTAAANHLKLVPPEGDKLGRYSPSTWIPGSMHPNVLGHELTAEATVCTVARQLEMSAASGTIAGSRSFECTAADAAVDDGAGDPAAGAAGGADDTSEACQAALSPGGAATLEEAAACAAVSRAVDEQIEEQIEELAAEVAVVTEELVSDDEWIRVELFRTVRALALPLLLLLALGMVFAWGFAQLDNPLSRFLRQERDRPSV